MKTKIKTERGQSLVEMAISLVVILFLLSGVVEFGIAFFQFIQLRDAAQEGALFASINPPATTASNDPNRLLTISRVRAASNKPIDMSEAAGLVTVTVTVTGSPCAGNAVTVDVFFRHQVFMPFVSPIFTAMSGDGSNTIPLTGSVTDTILQPACP